jgi:hypothetical protein
MHPYKSLPPRHFWNRFVASASWRDIPFMDAPPFRLDARSRIATAGSCFAQHITRHLRQVGLQPYVAEAPHPWLQAAPGESSPDGHGQFAARYGNVYTARQCVELFEQALQLRPVIEDLAEQDGRWYDLLRPGVPRLGFASRAEACADRAYHLHCVGRMLETVDVFVFTLGLTEAWQHATGGHTYPVCPGTVRGTFEPSLHRFHNFRHAEVVADLERLIALGRRANPALRFIFTVSPVPLVATRSTDNVLVASSYSKAVLRAAVGEVVAAHDGVAYFPSFEIISQPGSHGQYLATDLREVADRGVAHVMACFVQAFFGADPSGPGPAGAAAGSPAVPAMAAAPAPLADCALPPVECEEAFNLPAGA